MSRSRQKCIAIARARVIGVIFTTQVMQPTQSGLSLVLCSVQEEARELCHEAMCCHKEVQVRSCASTSGTLDLKAHVLEVAMMIQTT